MVCSQCCSKRKGAAAVVRIFKNTQKNGSSSRRGLLPAFMGLIGGDSCGTAVPSIIRGFLDLQLSALTCPRPGCGSRFEGYCASYDRGFTEYVPNQAAARRAAASLTGLLDSLPVPGKPAAVSAPPECPAGVSSGDEVSEQLRACVDSCLEDERTGDACRRLGAAIQDRAEESGLLSGASAGGDCLEYPDSYIEAVRKECIRLCGLLNGYIGRCASGETRGGFLMTARIPVPRLQCRERDCRATDACMPALFIPYSTMSVPLVVLMVSCRVLLHWTFSRISGVFHVSEDTVRRYVRDWNTCMDRFLDAVHAVFDGGLPRTQLAAVCLLGAVDFAAFAASYFHSSGTRMSFLQQHRNPDNETVPLSERRENLRRSSETC